MKKLGLGLVGLVVLLVAAVLVAPSLIDWNAQKDRIAAEVERLTGRRLAIAGDVNLTLLPAPALSAGQVRLANVEGGSTPAMVELEALEVRIAFLPLLRGDVQVERVALIEPVIVAEVLPDGRRNWEFGPLAGETAEAPADGAVQDGVIGAGVPGEIRLDSLRIVEGTVIYRDARSGLEEQVDELNAEIVADSLAGPFAATGEARVRGIATGFEFNMGRLVSEGATALGLSLRLPDAKARLQFSGALSLHPGQDVYLRGGLKGQGESLAALLGTVARLRDLPPLLARPFQVETELTADPTQAGARALRLRLGETAVEGEIQVRRGPPLDAQIRLSASRIDLDELLAPSAAGAGGGQAAEGRPAPAAQPDQAEDPAGEAEEGGGLTLPQDVTGRLEVAVDALVYRGQIVRQAMLSLALADGRLEVSQALALLPGGSDVSLTGSAAATSENGAPELRFDGRLEAASDNLRAVLDWLGVGVAGVPAERLRKMSLSGALSATPRQLTLSEIDLSLDLSRATGGIVVALRERPGFGIGLAVDKLNVDAYLPPTRPAEGTAPARPAETAGTEAGSGAEPAPGAWAMPGGLGALDANLDLRVGSLTVRGVTAGDVRLDATLQQGALSLRELRVANLGGSSARLSGTVGALTEKPQLDAAFEVQVPDPVRLAKALNVAPGMLARVGELGLSGTAQGVAERVAFAAELTTLGGRFGATGAVQPLLAAPDFDVTVTGQHAELGELVRALAPGTRIEGKLGALSLVTRLAGTPERIEVSRLSAVLGPLQVSGGFLARPEGPPPVLADIDLEVAAKHPDLPTLVRAVAPDVALGRDLGGVDLTARVTGSAQAFQVRELAGRVGSSELSGSFGADLSGERPALDLDLETGVLPLGALLAAGGADQDRAGAPARQAAPGATAAASGRWSREPIDLAALNAFDATLRLNSAALVMGDLRLDKATVDAGLAGGVLDLRKLAGTLYGGALSVTGKVDARQEPAAGLAVTAVELDLARLLADLAETDRVSGPLNVNATLNTRGRSQAELVSALSGQGDLTGTLHVKAKAQDQVGAVLLEALGQKVKEIRGVTDATNLLFTAFADAPAALSGTFTIERGVLRTEDLRADGRQAFALTRGTADLPAWQLDTRTSVYRAGETVEPYLTVGLRGPIDAPNPRLSGPVLRGGAAAPAEQPSGSQPTAPEPSQPQQIKPEDVLKEGLKGLLKGLQN